MSPNLGSCWGSCGIQPVWERFLDFRQAGVGLGDKPAVSGDCLRSLVFPKASWCRLVRPSAIRSTQLGHVIRCNGVRRSWSSWMNPSFSVMMSSMV